MKIVGAESIYKKSLRATCKNCGAKTKINRGNMKPEKYNDTPRVSMTDYVYKCPFCKSRNKLGKERIVRSWGFNQL